jgi:hypothetical protein
MLLRRDDAPGVVLFFGATPRVLGNQLGIHIILAKQEKLASNSLANELSKK